MKKKYDEEIEKFVSLIGTNLGNEFILKYKFDLQEKLSIKIDELLSNSKKTIQNNLRK